MVDDNDVKRYLLKNKVLTEANICTYKISRPYQLGLSIEVSIPFIGYKTQNDIAKHQ